MPGQAIGLLAAHIRLRPHFGPAHPLADVAGQLCQSHPSCSGIRLGQAACERAWEEAIRRDHEMVVLCDIPVEHPAADPNYIDAVAVDLALNGEPVRLTPAEQLEVDRWFGLAAPATDDHLAVAA